MRWPARKLLVRKPAAGEVGAAAKACSVRDCNEQWMPQHRSQAAAQKLSAAARRLPDVTPTESTSASPEMLCNLLIRVIRHAAQQS